MRVTCPRIREWILVGLLMLLVSGVRAATKDAESAAIAAVLNRFHVAAGEADFDAYFALFAEDGVFLGTDATERWTVAEFKAFVRPHFEAGRGWLYTPGERHVVLSPDGRYAWFDEALSNTSYGACRGSGVMQLTADGWKVAQYHLTIPIPNDLAKSVVDLIREHHHIVEIVPLAEGVWLHQATHETEDWGRVSSNGLIVEDGERLIVIDTAWGTENSQALMRRIEVTMKRPVTDLIITHFHGDSMAGWEVFKAAGATVWVTRQSLALAQEQQPEAFQVIDPEVGQQFGVGSVSVFYPGPAHAPDNVVVWVPRAEVLFGGCAVRSEVATNLGNTGDASIPQWAASIARVQAAFPSAKWVVPGHGKPGGAVLLAHTIKLANAANGASGEQ